MSKLFLVTGVSTGFGRAIAVAAAEAGHTVVGTVRNERDAEAFHNLVSGRTLARHLDITDIGAIAPLVRDVERNLGAIDVLVNNAGFGHEGIFEESSLEALRHQFEVNVFGPIALTQAVLPYMRQRRQGHIINITSVGGLITLPGLSFYHGSKFALEGLTESLASEVKGLGIKVTAVEPGGFRTDWAGRSMVRAQRSLADYDEVFEPMRQQRLANSGHQPGDPMKLGRVVVQLTDLPNPPGHLLLGNDAYRRVIEKLDSMKSEIEANKALSLSTDFEQFATA